MSRFQLLIFTFVISMSLFEIIVSKTPPEFPQIPTEILALLGISGGSYLVSKGIQANMEINKENNKAQNPPAPQPAGGVQPAVPAQPLPGATANAQAEEPQAMG